MPLAPDEIEPDRDPPGRRGVDPAARDLHLARVRASELEDRVAQLSALLHQSELRGAEVLRLRARVGALENENAATREELHAEQAARHRCDRILAEMNSSASWRLTAGLRAAKRAWARLFG